MAVPAHLEPDSCHICGGKKHPPAGESGHTFWSNAEAEKHFAEEDRRMSPVNYSPEAAYVAQHRPY